MDKIDPKLLQLIDAHAAGELPADPENPDFLVHVYVVVENDDFGGVAAAGYEVASELGGIGVVTLPIPQIESLADRADVLAIYAPRAGQPADGPPPIVHTIDQRSIRLDEAYGVKSHTRPNGSHGEDVLIGIVDSGVNILHDAFTVHTIENGKPIRKTRIIAYWAQGTTRSSGATPLWQRNGTVFSEADINARLAAFDTSGALPPAGLIDEGGHGTGVASVAGGSEWTAGPDAVRSRTGIAPASRFIVVSGQIDNTAGVEFCFAKATEASLPCVVNMSQGDHDQPHNGLSVFCHRLRAMLTQGSPASFRPGRAFVAAAGNEGVSHNHMRFSLQQPKLLDIQVDPEEVTLGCHISSTKPGLKVSLAAPAAKPAFSPVGPRPASMAVSGHVVTIRTLPSVTRSNPDDLPSDTDTHIHVEANVNITATSGIFIRPGAWHLKLDPGGTPHPEVHIWSYWGYRLDSQKLDDPDFELGWATEDDGSGMELRWRRREEWIFSTLRSEACSREAIVVGATTWVEDKKVMSPYRPSSRGPATEAGRPPADLKPDLVAPGDNIVVARWRKPKRPGDPSSVSRYASGTSFASPAVAGAVALMLSHDPTLTQDDIRKILRATTSPWAPIVNEIAFKKRKINEQNIAGRGLLNIEAALNSVKARVGP
ncbi:MAG: S8 family serine peptidase [Alphaproteobacteria bacterium]